MLPGACLPRPRPPPLSVHVHGHHLVLHAERALELPDRARALIVADLHWGKATALRALGVPVPAGGTAQDLRRLDTVLARTNARELCILGDLAHSHHGWDERALVPVLRVASTVAVAGDHAGARQSRPTRR
jgi:uncharacterized protein